MPLCCYLLWLRASEVNLKPQVPTKPNISLEDGAIKGEPPSHPPYIPTNIDLNSNEILWQRHTTTVAYLDLAVIQNACIQIIESQKVKMKGEQVATRAEQAFYEFVADSPGHWRVVFKGQIEGWRANSPVQYFYFCVTKWFFGLISINVQMKYLVAIYSERFMNHKFEIFCKLFRYLSRSFCIGMYQSSNTKVKISNRATGPPGYGTSSKEIL